MVSGFAEFHRKPRVSVRNGRQFKAMHQVTGVHKDVHWPGPCLPCLPNIGKWTFIFHWGIFPYWILSGCSSTGYFLDNVLVHLAVKTLPNSWEGWLKTWAHCHFWNNISHTHSSVASSPRSSPVTVDNPRKCLPPQQMAQEAVKKTPS